MGVYLVSFTHGEKNIRECWNMCCPVLHYGESNLELLGASQGEFFCLGSYLEKGFHLGSYLEESVPFG